MSSDKYHIKNIALETLRSRASSIRYEEEAERLVYTPVNETPTAQKPVLLSFAGLGATQYSVGDAGQIIIGKKDGLEAVLHALNEALIPYVGSPVAAPVRVGEMSRR